MFINCFWFCCLFQGKLTLSNVDTTLRIEVLQQSEQRVLSQRGSVINPKHGYEPELTVVCLVLFGAEEYESYTKDGKLGGCWYVYIDIISTQFNYFFVC